MARIEGMFWDVENNLPIYGGVVTLMTVDGKEKVYIDVMYPDGITRTVPITASSERDGKYIIEYALPGEYMLIATTEYHHPQKAMLVGDDAVVEPGIEVNFGTTLATLRR